MAKVGFITPRSYFSTAPMNFLNVASELGREIGLPSVSGDLALFWAALRALGAEPPGEGHGTLLDRLRR